MNINLEAARIALDRISGERFEKFVLTIGPEIFGEKFIPLGGMHDGGADAFQDADSTGMFSGNSTGTFYQASREEDYRVKIKKTLRRLRKFGRVPTRVVYLTPNVVPHIDRRPKGSPPAHRPAPAVLDRLDEHGIPLLRTEAVRRSPQGSSEPATSSSTISDTLLRGR